jgi:ribonuclease-3
MTHVLKIQTTSSRDTAADRDGTTELERLLGHQFKNPRWLREALSHRSVLRASGGPRPSSDLVSNERLEFLGDSVLGGVMASILYSCQYGLSEGEMTRIKSSLVRNETLAKKAREQLSLGRFIRAHHREMTDGTVDQDGPLSDAVEAIIGAIFKDGGIEAVDRFVRHFYDEELKSDLRDLAALDAKSELMKLARRHTMGDVSYQIFDHHSAGDERFEAIVYAIRGRRKRFLGKGYGPNVRKAETAAAADALRRMPTADRRRSSRRFGDARPTILTPEQAGDAASRPSLLARVVGRLRSILGVRS